MQNQSQEHSYKDDGSLSQNNNLNIQNCQFLNDADEDDNLSITFNAKKAQKHNQKMKRMSHQGTKSKDSCQVDAPRL